MSEPVLDLAVFHEIRELMDDALGEFIKTYLANSPNLINQMEQGLATGDTECIYQNAHQLKGGSGSIGAMRLFELAQQIELTGKSGSIDGIDTLLTQLKAEYERVEIALKKYM